MEAFKSKEFGAGVGISNDFGSVKLGNPAEILF